MMKKILLFMLISASVANAQDQADRAPYVKDYNPISSKALWDVQDSFATKYGNGKDALGLAAVNYMFGNYWTAKWSGDSILRYDASGTFVDAFKITGLSGTRSFTTDGTYIYAANNTTTIYRIDPQTKLLAPPHITSASPNNVRHCSFDKTLDGGAGGFWIGNFNTDIEALNINGGILNTITTAEHTLTGMYGSAIDNKSVGGPFLWVYNQAGANRNQLEAISISSKALAGISKDVFPDFGPTYGLTGGSSGAIAGGMFISSDLKPGTVTIGGMIQGTKDVIFNYELVNTAGVVELVKVKEIKLSPNPTKETLKVDLSNVSNASSMKVINAVGQVVYATNDINAGSQVIDVRAFEAGVYFVAIEAEGNVTNQKFVVVK